MADGPIITKTEYARHRGVSQAQVSHWTNAKRIKIVDGKVDRDASDAMLAAGLDPSRGGRGGSPRNRREPGPPPAAADVQAPQGGGIVDTFTRVRTVREGFRARSEEVEYRRTIGELVERDKYNKALADGLGPILAALDSLGPRLATRLVGETDARVIQNMIDDAVAAMRQDMADTLMRLVQGGVTQ